MDNVGIVLYIGKDRQSPELMKIVTKNWLDMEGDKNMLKRTGI